MLDHLTPRERRWFLWALVMALLIGACLGLLTAEWALVPVSRP